MADRRFFPIHATGANIHVQLEAARTFQSKDHTHMSTTGAETTAGPPLPDAADDFHQVARPAECLELALSRILNPFLLNSIYAGLQPPKGPALTVRPIVRHVGTQACQQALGKMVDRPWHFCWVPAESMLNRCFLVLTEHAGKPVASIVRGAGSCFDTRQPTHGAGLGWRRHQHRQQRWDPSVFSAGSCFETIGVQATPEAFRGGGTVVEGSLVYQRQLGPAPPGAATPRLWGGRELGALAAGTPLFMATDLRSSRGVSGDGLGTTRARLVALETIFPLARPVAVHVGQENGLVCLGAWSAWRVLDIEPGGEGPFPDSRLLAASSVSPVAQFLDCAEVPQLKN